LRRAGEAQERPADAISLRARRVRATAARVGGFGSRRRESACAARRGWAARGL